MVCGSKKCKNEAENTTQMFFTPLCLPQVSRSLLSGTNFRRWVHISGVLQGFVFGWGIKTLTHTQFKNQKEREFP